MTVSLKHAFTSNVADSGDTTLVQPSNWNAEHTLTAAADTLLGAVTSGAVTEITCTAAGRALLDDATASAQRTTLGLGTTDSPTFGSSITLNSSSSFLPQMILNNTAADNTGPYWLTRKFRGSSPANSGDSLGTFIFQSSGNDGLTYNSAFIASISEGAGATWHAAGFGFNTINTSGVTARRMRIRASGCVAIGSDGAENFSLYVAKAITGAGSAYGTVVETSVQSDVTTLGAGFATALSTVASAFTIASLQHYRAYQVTIGAGSTVSDQMGFFTSSTVIGATNNYAFYSSNLAGVTAGKIGYGFYSGMNTATGGGTTYAFYGAGTAPSVFSGAIGIGSTSISNVNMIFARSITGSTSAHSIFHALNVASDVTANAYVNRTFVGTQAAAFTLTSLFHYSASQATIGAGSTVTNQYGFSSGGGNVDASLNYAFIANDTAAVTTGKVAYGFYSGINSATGGGTAWAFYGGGTAPSVFNGAIGVGSTSISNVNMIFARSITGNASTSHSILHSLNVLADVTGAAYVNRSYVGTQAAAFTLTSLVHYGAEQAPIGAGSAVTSQYGFFSGSGNIDASINYAFFAQNTAAVTAAKTAYGFYSNINIASGGGTTWNFYGAGTAPSVFSGAIGVGNTVLTGFNIRVTRNITGATSFYSIRSDSTILSDVTTSAISFSSAVGTQAAAFTLAALTHYSAEQAVLGAGSSVTAQYGFISRESLVGATTNYGFFANNTAAVTAGKTAYGFYSAISSATGGGTTYAFYSAGTAPNVFAGTVSIGTSVAATVNLYLTKTLTGGVNAFGIASDGTFQSDVTNLGVGVGATVSTAAASFTLGNLSIFRAAQGTFGAGSTVTSQYGYNATASLIGATNNYAFAAQDTAAVTAGKSAYGFHSSLNIASGGGTAYAFYAAGTATSVFSGAIGVGTTSLTGYTLRVTRNISGATTAYAARIESTIQSDVTVLGSSYSSLISTAAAAFSTQITHYDAAQGSIGAGSTVTSQYGFLSRSTLVGATNNYAYAALDTSAIATGNTAYGFHSAINIATGGGTAYAVYTAGTAPSVFSGNVGIGSTSLTNVIFRVSKAITGSTTSYGVFTNSTVQSDVTASAVFYYSGPSTAAAAFTLGSLTHYFAAIGTIGAGSSITNQYGFRGDAALIDATTNYSFYAANTAAVTSGKTSYGFYSNVAVASGGGTTWSFYSASTGWNYFSGPTITADVLWVKAPAPAAKTTTATLTAAEIKTGIISTTGTSYTLTMPLATDIDSSFSGLPSNTNIGFDFSVVNTASGTITIAVNTGITSLGSLTVATGTSATFRLRRTAANTYIIYRLS